MKRVLVTGSRDWTDERQIRDVLLELSLWRGFMQAILVSGACPTGADLMAEGLAEAMEWTIERHPADWDTYGKRAGFLRNSEMVNLGANACLAFIKNESRGASMTARLAEEAGIPTWRFTK